MPSLLLIGQPNSAVQNPDLLKSNLKRYTLIRNVITATASHGAFHLHNVLCIFEGCEEESHK
jgi:hypothetical protein